MIVELTYDIRIKRWTDSNGEELFFVERFAPSNCHDELGWISAFILKKEQFFLLGKEIEKLNIKKDV